MAITAVAGMTLAVSCDNDTIVPGQETAPITEESGAPTEPPTTTMAPIISGAPASTTIAPDDSSNAEIGDPAFGPNLAALDSDSWPVPTTVPDGYTMVLAQRLRGDTLIVYDNARNEVIWTYNYALDRFDYEESTKPTTEIEGVPWYTSDFADQGSVVFAHSINDRHIAVGGTASNDVLQAVVRDIVATSTEKLDFQFILATELMTQHQGYWIADTYHALGRAGVIALTAGHSSCYYLVEDGHFDTPDPTAWPSCHQAPTPDRPVALVDGTFDAMFIADVNIVDLRFANPIPEDVVVPSLIGQRHEQSLQLSEFETAITFETAIWTFPGNPWYHSIRDALNPDGSRKVDEYPLIATWADGTTETLVYFDVVGDGVRPTIGPYGAFYRRTDPPAQ